jgi:hypothetical protein
LLSIQLASQQRGVFRVGIDGQVCQQPVEEGLARKPKDRTVRSIEAVNEADGGFDILVILLRPL